MIDFVTRFRSLAKINNFLNMSDTVRDQFISLYGSKKLRAKLIREKEIASEKCIQVARLQI